MNFARELELETDNYRRPLQVGMSYTPPLQSLDSIAPQCNPEKQRNNLAGKHGLQIPSCALRFRGALGFQSSGFL